MLCRNGKVPDVKVKIFGKTYNFHKEIIQKSSFMKALISDKWSKGEKINIECKDTEEEKCILRVIDTMYLGLHEYEDIPEDDMLRMIELADYLGYPELVKMYAKQEIYNISLDTLNKQLVLGIKLYDKDTSLYKMCIKLIANDVKKYKNILFDPDTDLRVLYDLANELNLWFESHYKRYRFACNIAQRFEIKDLKLHIYENKTYEINRRSIVEKWFSYINYHQFSADEIESIILDGYLSLEDLKKIIIIKKKFLTEKNMLYTSTIYVKFNLNIADIVSINCGSYSFTVRLLPDVRNGIYGCFIRYTGDEKEIDINYSLILFPSIYNDEHNIKHHNLTLKSGEELGYKEEISLYGISCMIDQCKSLNLIFKIESICVIESCNT